MRTRHLTVMFTDIKGYTSRTALHSREELHRLLYVHDDLIRPIFDHYKGKVVKTIGDAFMVAFETPTDAVLCGMKIQNTLAIYNKELPKKERIEVRIAINTGEVNVKDGDVFGEPVNIAARIESLAKPNNVYFTEAVYLSMNKNEIPSSEVGEAHLKGIPDRVKIYKVLHHPREHYRYHEKRAQLVEASHRPKRKRKWRKRHFLLLLLALLAIAALAGLSLMGLFTTAGQATISLLSGDFAGAAEAVGNFTSNAFLGLARALFGA